MNFNKRIIYIVITFFIIILVIKFIPLGTKNYHSSKLTSSLIVPRFSVIKDEKDNKDNYIATFKTIKNKTILKLQLDKIMNNLEKKTCHYDTYYYDKDNDVTIEKYKIKSGILFNEITITYGKGEYSNVLCNVITDPTRIEYRYFHIDEGVEIKPLYKYLNEDGNLYDVHTTCDYCLSIKKGMGYNSFFEELLESSYMSMDDLITFLNHQVKIGDATKNVAVDGYSTVYKNKDFTLIKCDTPEGNKDVYFDERLDSSIDYCNKKENY